jgi:hypothetical protein
LGKEDGWVYAHNIWEALEISLERVGDKEQQKLGHAMKALGFTKKRMTRNKARVPYYERISTEGAAKWFSFRYDLSLKRWVLNSWREITDAELDEYDQPFDPDDIFEDENGEALDTD